jgi:PAS domain S-box-containing protein
LSTYELLNKVVGPEETGECVFSSTGEPLYCDERFLAFAQTSKTELKSYSAWLEAVLGEHGTKRLVKAFDSVLTGKVDREALECVATGGDHILMQLSLLEHTPKGQEPCISMTVKDITHEKQNKTDLLIGTLIENASQPLCVFLLNGDILSVNPALCELYGLPRQKMEGLNFFDIVDLSYRELRDLQIEEGGSRRLYDKTCHLPNKYNIPVELFVGSYKLDVSVTPIFYAFITDHRLFQEHEALKRQLLWMSRQRDLSRDLHDNVAQSLALVGMRFDKFLKGLGDNVPDEQIANVVECRRMLDQAQTEMRAVIRHLREETSVRTEDCLWSIEEVLRYAHDVLSLEVIDMGVASLSRLDENVSRQITQLIREALTNVYKHSGVKTVWLSVIPDDDILIVSVMDKGTGFDVTKGKEGHYGLEMMQERLQALGGEVVIISAPSKGTNVTFKIPCNDKI